jgi:hypothetical protein
MVLVFSLFLCYYRLVKVATCNSTHKEDTVDRKPAHLRTVIAMLVALALIVLVARLDGAKNSNTPMTPVPTPTAYAMGIPTPTPIHGAGS